jgi:uncharacterized lipoprotein YddW (UPF0748 family)
MADLLLEYIFSSIKAKSFPTRPGLYGVFPVLFMLVFSTSAQCLPRFGLWVEAEGQNQPFLNRSNFARYQEFSEAGGFTDLYCQVYRGGRAWYPSLMANDDPFRDGLAQGIDPLKETINFAHKRGMRVHAWINALRVTRNFEAPVLKIVGRDAVLKNTYGESVLDYDDDGNPVGKLRRGFKLDTPGIWLDPSNERLRKYIVETIRDVIVAYPELDGIHLDMIRHPMAISSGGGSSASSVRPDFGYAEDSIVRFYEFAGKEAPEVSEEVRVRLRKSEAWSAWRRAQLTLLVFEIREMMNSIAPEMELSAAVIGSKERAYGEMFQDWGEWLRAGVMNSVVLMSYTKSSETVAHQTRQAVAVASRGEVLAGLGAWLMLGDQSGLAEQGKRALQAGANGVALFSYSNLESPRGRALTSHFQRTVFVSE